jgi:hypothetical protein
MTILLCIVSGMLTGSICFLLGAVMATAKRADEQDEALYRQVVNEDIAEFERRYQAAQ